MRQVVRAVRVWARLRREGAPIRTSKRGIESLRAGIIDEPEGTSRVDSACDDELGGQLHAIRIDEQHCGIG